MTSKIIRIGTRGSALALAQAGQIQRLLQKKYRGHRFELVIIQTRGDEFQSVELFKQKHVGFFTKAIEEALLNKKIDIAVHSLKDLPTDLTKGLCLAAYPKREKTQDVLLTKKKISLKNLPAGARIGTTSLRRQRQLLLCRPDLRVENMRGNLDTRVAKVLQKGEYDGIVVARAGLLRLKRFLKNAVDLPENKMLPAAGQGALGIQIRQKDRGLFEMLKSLNHPETEILVKAERIFLKTLQGGCRVPVGILARLQKGELSLKAAVFSVREAAFVASAVQGKSGDYAKLARKLARVLLENGAYQFLREARADV